MIRLVQEPLISIYNRTKLEGTRLTRCHYSILPSGQRCRSLAFRTESLHALACWKSPKEDVFIHLFIHLFLEKHFIYK